MTMKHAPQCEGRYVLTTTYGSVLLLDLVNMEQVCINRGYRSYYGITASDSHIYISARKSTSPLIQGKDSNAEILVYDYNFTLTQIIKPDFPLHEVHEILWHKGKLYVANTGYDMIAIYDGASWEQWYPLGKPQGKKQDVHHFNSISVYDDKIYIVAHNHGPSFVSVFLLETKQKIDEIQLGACAHNMWFSNDVLYVCSSDEGIVKNTQGFVKHIAEWPRGIALCQNRTIVGSSALGGLSDPYGMHNGHIYAYDNDWNIKGLMLLQGESQVYEVFPIEQCLDPAKFFDDSRFAKQKVVGISVASEITKNEEVLLGLYSASSIRSGRMYMAVNKCIAANERRSFSRRFKKLKRSIYKKLHSFGIVKE